MGIISGERFFTRDEESCTFGSHRRLKFEIKSGFIYLQENPTSALQYLLLIQQIYLKHWEACLQMERSVVKLRVFKPSHK